MPLVVACFPWPLGSRRFSPSPIWPLPWSTIDDSASRSASNPRGGYGFATLDQVEIHLGVVPPSKASTPASAYLFVDDADELAQAWRASGADVRVPVDTEWGMHEGVVIDPDGNVIRFGSPMAAG